MKSQDVLAASGKTIHFSNQPVSRQEIEELIQAARSIPTQFNLQPTHYWVVTNQEIKQRLLKPCLNNRHVIEAPILIVFTGDRYCAKNQDVLIDQELEKGTLTVGEAETLEQQIKMYFDVSPIGLGWIGKLFANPILRLFTDMPRLACIHKREWLTNQVMRNATLLWYCAKEMGYSAEFIDMYDEWRLRSELSIPWHHIVVTIIALGYASEVGPGYSKLDQDVIH